MKHTGKQGKRQGPTGFRTQSTFLARKSMSNKQRVFRRNAKG